MALLDKQDVCQESLKQLSELSTIIDIDAWQKILIFVFRITNGGRVRFISTIYPSHKDLNLRRHYLRVLDVLMLVVDVVVDDDERLVVVLVVLVLLGPLPHQRHRLLPVNWGAASVEKFLSPVKSINPPTNFYPLVNPPNPHLGISNFISQLLELNPLKHLWARSRAEVGF